MDTSWVPDPARVTRSQAPGIPGYHCRCNSEFGPLGVSPVQTMYNLTYKCVPNEGSTSEVVNRHKVSSGNLV
eukprot:1195348-Prorocentrum_minimum.AAC.12